MDVCLTSVPLIQWSPRSTALVASNEYGIIDGRVWYCIGDNPEYAAEGYPPLSAVPEGRAVFCAPNAVHWWNALAYHAPHPVIFDVDDDALVVLGQIDHGRNQRVRAADALATLHGMLAQVDPGASLRPIRGVRAPSGTSPGGEPSWHRLAPGR